MSEPQQQQGFNCKYNANGQFVCVPLPSGSYQKTCKDCYVDYDRYSLTRMLRCDCPIHRGSATYKPAFVTPDSQICVKDGIANCGGKLRCGDCFNDALKL